MLWIGRGYIYQRLMPVLIKILGKRERKDYKSTRKMSDKKVIAKGKRIDPVSIFY